MSEERGTETPRTWRSLLRWVSENPLLSTVVGGLIVLAVGAFFVDPFRGGGTAGSTAVIVTRDGQVVPPAEPPKSAVDEASQRPMWASPPDTFESANEQVAGQAPVLGGDVQAYTPRDLFENAPTYEGSALYVVGRVVGIRDRKSEHGIESEIHIVGADRGYDAFIGTSSTEAIYVDEGVVIYALGRVAAAGDTTEASGAQRHTVYILALGSGDLGPVDFSGSDSIRDAAKGVRQLRKPVPGGLGLF